MSKGYMRRAVTVALLVSLATGTVLAKRDAKPAPSPADVHPLLIGAEAPSVTLSGVDGSRVELGTLLKEQPTILVLYRGGW